MGIFRDIFLKIVDSYPKELDLKFEQDHNVDIPVKDNNELKPILNDVKIVWTNDHAEQLYNYFQQKIDEAFKIPAYMVGSDQVVIDRFKQSKMIETAYLRKHAEELLKGYSQPVIEWRNSDGN